MLSCVCCRFLFPCLQSLRSWWRLETTPVRRLRVGHNALKHCFDLIFIYSSPFFTQYVQGGALVFNITRISCSYLTALAQTIAILLSHFKKLNTTSQPKFSQWLNEHIHINGEVFPRCNESQTCTSVSGSRVPYFPSKEQTIIFKQIWRS